MRFFILCLLFFLPFELFAGVRITEIMYDLSGGDAGREWVEIVNEGSEAIDLSDWWFYENGNHGFQNVGDMTLPAGAYAIIADTPSTFLSEWTDVSVLVLDSSAFALKNTGERIAVRDSEKNDVDVVEYVPIESASGGGHSLQLVDGVWVANIPTPGVSSAVVSDGGASDSSTEESSSNANASQSISSGADAGWAVDSNEIHVRAGVPATIVAGALAEFSAHAYGFSGARLETAEYAWTFGDGAYEHGQSIFHVYYHPGKYVVFVSAESGKYSASDRVDIVVRDADVSISQAVAGHDGFVEITNGATTVELDLSGWIINDGTRTYIIPNKTILLPGVGVKFSARTTGFIVSDPTRISLYYPGGFLAARFVSGETRSVVLAEMAAPAKVPQSIKPVSPAPSRSVPSQATGNLETPERNTVPATSSAAVVLYTSVGDGGESDKENHSDLGAWLIGALVLSLLGVFGMIISRSRSAQSDEAHPEEEYEIIEYDENK